MLLQALHYILYIPVRLYMLLPLRAYALQENRTSGYIRSTLPALYRLLLRPYAPRGCFHQLIRKSTRSSDYLHQTSVQCSCARVLRIRNHSLRQTHQRSCGLLLNRVLQLRKQYTRSSAELHSYCLRNRELSLLPFSIYRNRYRMR